MQVTAMTAIRTDPNSILLLMLITNYSRVLVCFADQVCWFEQCHVTSHLRNIKTSALHKTQKSKASKATVVEYWIFSYIVILVRAVWSFVNLGFPRLQLSDDLLLLFVKEENAKSTHIFFERKCNIIMKVCVRYYFAQVYTHLSDDDTKTWKLQAIGWLAWHCRSCSYFISNFVFANTKLSSVSS